MIQNMRNIYQHCSSLQTAWSLAADSYGVSQCSESFWEGSCLPLNALPAGYFTRACSSVQPIEISIDVQLWEPSIHISHWRHAGPWIGTVKRDSSMYHLANGTSDDTTSSHLLQGEIIDERERMKEGVACNLNCLLVRTYSGCTKSCDTWKKLWRLFLTFERPKYMYRQLPVWSNYSRPEMWRRSQGNKWKRSNTPRKK